MKRYFLLGLGLIVVTLVCVYYFVSTYTNYLAFMPTYFSKNEQAGNGWMSSHAPTSPIKITGVSDSYLQLLKKHGKYLFTQDQSISIVLTAETQKVTIDVGSEPIFSYSIEPGADVVVITLGISKEQAALFDEPRLQSQLAYVLLSGICEHSMAIELQTVPLAERSLRCDVISNELNSLIDSEVFTAVRVEKT